MARIFSSFSHLYLRQNPKNPNIVIRNIGISGGGGEEFTQTQEEISPNPDVSKFTEVAKDVSKFIRTQPRWERTIVSEFSDINLSDPNLLDEVLKNQNNALLSLRFFYWVRSRFIFPTDQHSYTVVFNGLVETKAANAAKKFLKLTNFTPEPSSLELYICCLCENGLIEDALDVFDQLKRIGVCPSLGTWNSALLGAVRAGKTDAVWKLYGEMMSCGVVADVETVSCLVQAFCADKKVSEGYQLLMQVLEDGHVPNNVAFIKLLSGFCNEGEYHRVSSLLHTMISKDIAPDIYVYQEIINGVCKGGMADEGLRIFNELKDRGYSPDNVMYTTMIDGLCKMKCLGDARKLWYEMIQKGIMPNEHTYDALINGCFEVGDINGAQKLYMEMLDRGIRGTTLIYEKMMVRSRGLCSHGKTEEACALFEQMQQKGFAPNEHTYDALINGCFEVGDINGAQKLYMEMLDRGIRGTTLIYEKMMVRSRGLCEHGKTEEACALFEQMQQKGFAYDLYTYNAVIKGFCEEGKIVEGIKLVHQLLEQNLRPWPASSTAVINKLCEVGEMHQAISLWKVMLKRNVLPVACTRDMIIIGLSKKGYAAEGVEWLVEMLKCKFRPKRRTFETLIQSLLQKDRLSDVLRVLDYMLKLGYAPNISITKLLVNKLCKSNSPPFETYIEDKVHKKLYLLFL